MAVIYSEQKGPDHFQVRTAGASVRLYSNGVLHSQYNPNRLISGAIWDLLVLPGFFLSSAPKNVLVLGLGGGTVVHLIRYFFPDCDIHCVEREPIHIKIAKQHFNLPRDVNVIQGDAYDILANIQHKFDWILDDVFQHVSGEPERDVSFDKIFSLYENALSTKGVLSINTIGSLQLKQLKTLKTKFKSSYVLRHPLYDNAIVSMNLGDVTKAQFFKQILSYKELDTRRKTCPLKVSLRPL